MQMKIGLEAANGTRITFNTTPNGQRGTNNRKERMRITNAGYVQIHNLAGTGDRAVFADENGVLKTGTMSIKTSTTDATCSATNEGTMHYKLVDRNGKQVGLFGFCTRDANGEFLWAYQLGGNNMFSVSGNQAFGTGL